MSVFPIPRSLIIVLIGLPASFSTHDTAAQDGHRSDLPTLFSWAGCEVEPRGDVYSEPLQTDRPDFTEASATVGRGVIQIELGYLFAEDDDLGGQRLAAHAYPNSLLRVGLFRDWFELRLGWTILDERLSGGGQRDSSVGADDLVLGVKLALTEQCGYRPEMALILQMAVPTGSAEFTANEVLAGGVLVYSLEINDCWSVGGQTQLNQSIDDLDHDFTEFGQSAVSGFSLTEKLGCFVEWFALIPHSAVSADAQPVHFLDGGFTFLLNDNLQYDISAGVGLNDDATDYFLGTGLSARF